MALLRYLSQTRATLNRYLVVELAAQRSPIRSPNLNGPLKEPKIRLVIGNESCDLDSAVSALSYAFIYASRTQKEIVPVLNIPRIDYFLKTEVCYAFKNVGITEEMLIFRDDLPPRLSSNCWVVLVDHHISPYSRNVIEIFDHRPLDNSTELQVLAPQCNHHIEPSVGSCATLISEKYYEEDEPRCDAVTQLLHSTIILDTINFSPAVNRFCPRDVAMAEKHEQSLEKWKDIQDIPGKRNELLDELVAARADISTLTLDEVLRKDLKVIQTGCLSVPVAGLPILVADFVQKPDAAEAVRKFAAGIELLVILGMYVPSSNGDVQRDIALISLTGQTQLVERVKWALFECPEVPFALLPKDVNFLGGYFMHQCNVKATRKHILPVVKRAVLDWEAAQSCDDVYFFKEKPKLGLS